MRKVPRVRKGPKALTAPQDLQDWTYRAAQAVAADNLRLGRDVIAGAMVEADHIKTNMAAEGSAKMPGWGL